MQDEHDLCLLCHSIDFLMQDEHDLRVFRLCALWFANASDTKVNNIITVRSPLCGLHPVLLIDDTMVVISFRREQLSWRVASSFLSCTSWQPG